MIYTAMKAGMLLAGILFLAGLGCYILSEMNGRGTIMRIDLASMAFPVWLAGMGCFAVAVFTVDDVKW